MKKLLVLTVLLSTIYQGQSQIPEGWVISSYYIFINYDIDKSPVYLVYSNNEETYEEAQMLVKINKEGNYEQLFSNEELTEKGEIISYRGDLAVFSKDEELFAEKSDERKTLDGLFDLVSSNGFMGNSTDLRHLLSIGPKGDMLIYYDNQQDVLSTYNLQNDQRMATSVNGFDYSFDEPNFYFLKPEVNDNMLIESTLDKLNTQEQICPVPGGMNQTNYVVFDAGTKVFFNATWGKNYIFDRSTGKYRKALAGESDQAYFRGTDDQLKYLRLNEARNGFDVIDVYENAEALGEEFGSFDEVMSNAQSR